MGVPLSEYLTGQRKPAQALRFIKFLPLDSAFMAQIQANPDVDKSGDMEPWREFYGWSIAERISADTWDLLARVNVAKGKRSPEYPAPGKKKQKRPVARRGSRAHDGRGVMTDG